MSNLRGLFKHPLTFMTYNASTPSQNQLNRFKSRAGFGTLEIVIILAVLLTVAMLFRSTLNRYSYKLMEVVFKDSIIEDIDGFPD